MKRKNLLVIVSIFFVTSMSSETITLEEKIGKPKIKAVVFDLGGVLLGHSKIKYMKSIGFITLLKYIMTGHNPKNILNKIFEVLHQIKPFDVDEPTSLTPDGSQPLPQLFREWLTGRQLNVQLKKEATSFIDSHPEIFSGSIEQEFMRKAVTIIFSPDISTQFITPYSGSSELVQYCKDLGLNVFILSNFDAESYEILKEKYSELFDLFEEKNSLISGNLGTMKPDPNIFEILVESSGFEAGELLFFDDQNENIEAAKKYEINSIQVTKEKSFFYSSPDYKKMREYINDLIEVQSNFAIS